MDASPAVSISFLSVGDRSVTCVVANISISLKVLFLRSFFYRFHLMKTRAAVKFCGVTCPASP